MARIAFLQNIWTDCLGVMGISSLLKKHGHSSEIFIYTGHRRVPEELKHFRPDIVGFSVTTGLHRWALEMAELIKKELGCLVILGGPHATFFPEVIQHPEIDLICRGEGEYALLELANCLDQERDITKIKNLWVRKDGHLYKNEVRSLVQNLDELPFPDRSYYYKYRLLARREIRFFITSRGCPYHCTYCCNHALQTMYAGKGRYVRHRSPENVIAEIKEVKSQWKAKRVDFFDDIFILDDKWLEDFLNLYRREINLPFRCTLRADLVEEEIIRDLKEAGCEAVSFGIESGNIVIRNGLLAKGITEEEIEKIAFLLKKYKIKFKAYNMLGLPGETLKNAYETVKLNRKIKTDFPMCAIFTPYPGIELTERAKREGHLKADFDFDEIPSLFYKGSVLQQKYIRELTNLQKFFYLAVKYPFLDFLIKRLIKLPANKLFDWLGLAIHGYVMVFKLFKMKFSDALISGILSVKTFRD